MKMHITARKAVVAVALSGVAAIGTAGTANAAPASITLDKPGPVSFCSVFGGPIPIIGRLPFCQKKVEEKMSVPDNGPVTVPIER